MGAGPTLDRKKIGKRVDLSAFAVSEKNNKPKTASARLHWMTGASYTPYDSRLQYGHFMIEYRLHFEA
jgi:hypothetical protein